MWRAGMWYDDEKTTALGHLRNVGIVLGAFVATGVIFIVLQRSMDSVNKRISGAYTRSGDEAGTAPTFAPPASGGPASPFAPVAVPLNTYVPATRLPLTPTGSLPVEPPVYRVPAQYTLFTSDAEREKAHAAVSDLQVAVRDFKDYSSSGLQKSLALAQSGPSATGFAAAGELNAEGMPEDKSALDHETETNARQQIVVDRVYQETEGLGSLLTLTAHPDLFPESLRDEAGQVSRELHTYLQDVRYAASFPSERSRLLSLASQHLSQGENILQDMAQQVGNPSGGANFP